MSIFAFMKKIYAFLKALGRNNDRVWFAGHKEEYLAMKEEADRLAESLIALVGEVEPDALRFRASDVTYRIYRDTRFSADKTPYKTHVGIFINPPKGKKSMRCGYYFHIEPGASIVCGGNMPLPGKVTRAIRRSIYDDPDEYLSIIDDSEFKKYFPKVGQEWLKTAPQGFPKDWEHIELLRPKDYGVAMDVADEFYTAPGLADRLRPIIAQIKRFNDFINYTIDDFDAPSAD